MSTKHTMTLHRTSVTALSLALLMTTACTTVPEGHITRVLITRGAQPGIYAIEKNTITATVTGIDKDNRKITLVSPGGKKQVITAKPEVRNFDQITLGDQLIVTVAQEAIVFMAKDGLPAPDGTTGLAARAAAGEKPSLVVATSTQLTAKVIALDGEKHKATVQFTDGTKKIFDIREEVDLSRVSLGDEVIFRYSVGQAIRIQKP